MIKTGILTGLLPFHVESSNGCLEQHSDDALVICLCWIVLAYSVCLMLLSDHFLFSYISTRIILNARACLCKIYVLDFSVKLQKHNE